MSQSHKWSPVCDPPRGLVRPIRPRPADPNGPTKAQAAGPKWRQTTRGFYVPADVDPTVPEQRIIEQSMRLKPGGAVTGWASCRLRGANFFDGVLPDGTTLMPVPLAVGTGVQLAMSAEVSISRDQLDPDEVTLRCGIPCTTRLRGLFDAARDAPDLREAVVSIDMMAAAELASMSQLDVYVAARAGWRGVELVRRALLLADEGSRSPNETRTRLIWVLDAGLPKPLVNQEIFDLNGRLLGIADLLDPAAGVVVEFDGADHRRARRHSHDVSREEGFRNVDLEVCRVTGPDLPDRKRLVDRFESARARAKWLSAGERRWTLEPPPGGPRKLSLDERFAFQGEMREMHQDMAREIEQANLAEERRP